MKILVFSAVFNKDGFFDGFFIKNTFLKKQTLKSPVFCKPTLTEMIEMVTPKK